jgi:adenosine deaminase
VKAKPQKKPVEHAQPGRATVNFETGREAIAGEKRRMIGFAALHPCWRGTAPMTGIDQFIHDLPKCELHVHLEGTLEPDMKFALAARNAIDIGHKTVEEIRASYDFTDLPSFLDIYYSGMAVLLTEQDFFDLTYAYLAKARSENILYAEMFFDPQAHTARGVEFGTVIKGIRRAQQAAERDLGIASQLIMCFLRDQSAGYAMATLLESLPYKDWIVGVGLDSDEKDNPPVKFEAVFARARREGYRLTMHCDVNQQDSTDHIWQCLDRIGVGRIDHGVNSLDDTALAGEVAKRGLALTVCPVSNAFVTDGTQAWAIKKMLDLGMKVTLNSDDPAYFNAYLEENFRVVQKELDLDRAALTQLSRNAFESTWLPEDRKAAYLAKLPV